MFLPVALAVLELSLDQAGLGLSYTCPSASSAGNKGICHHCLAVLEFSM